MTIKGNCGPFALAAIIGIPVDEVERLYAKRYGKSTRWQGNSHIGGLVHLSKSIGHPLKKEGAGGSLKRWVSESIPGRKYLVRVGGHFVAVINGDVIDQYGDDRLDILAKRRVTHAYFTT